MQQKRHWGCPAQRATAAVFAVTHPCHVYTTLMLHTCSGRKEVKINEHSQIAHEYQQQEIQNIANLLMLIRTHFK